MGELMDEEVETDWLDARLRDETPYLDDAGFTASVLAKLPAPRRSRFSRHVILLGVTVIACLVAYLASGRGEFLAETVVFLVAVPAAKLWTLAGLVAAVVTGLGLTAALARARD